MKKSIISIIKNIEHQDNKNHHLVTFLNPYSYLLARKNLNMISQFNQIYIDGSALVTILKLFKLINTTRTSFDMTSLAPIVFSNAIKNDKSIYFIGTEPKVIDSAIETIQKSFPKLNIVGYRDGYIQKKERLIILEKIKALNPDIVVCGMGTPLQEKFLIDLQEIGWTGVGYTCGGFLHQTATNIHYYPNWINKYNIRWIYRIYDEPKLFKRYFWYYPKFLAVFTFDYLEYKFSNGLLK